LELGLAAEREKQLIGEMRAIHSIIDRTILPKSKMSSSSVSQSVPERGTHDEKHRIEPSPINTGSANNLLVGSTAARVKQLLSSLAKDAISDEDLNRRLTALDWIMRLAVDFR